MTKEERSLDLKLKDQKNKCLKKSDEEYINEIIEFIAKRDDIDIYQIRNEVKYSKDIRNLISNFRDNIKRITVLDDIRKEKLKLHQNARNIVLSKIE